MEIASVDLWWYKSNKIEEQEEGFCFKCSVLFKIGHYLSSWVSLCSSLLGSATNELKTQEKLMVHLDPYLLSPVPHTRSFQRRGRTTVTARPVLHYLWNNFLLASTVSFHLFLVRPILGLFVHCCWGMNIISCFFPSSWFWILLFYSMLPQVLLFVLRALLNLI